MHFSTVAFVSSTVSLAAAHPFDLSRRAVASFPSGSSWDIVLDNANTNLDDLSGTAAEGSSVIDLDLFDNDATTIGNLKSANKHVICYFSAGSYENWRQDNSSFTSNDYGKAMEDPWEGENWINIKSENVKKIMSARIKLAAQHGCNAIDPDNVDGYEDNQDGFGYAQSAYSDYVKFLAQEAASNNLAIGLKNAHALIPDVVNVVQFAVSEQCHQYGDCDDYQPFTAANKAIFNIEYDSEYSGNDKCASPSGVKLTTVSKKTLQLNSLGGACAGSGQTGTSPKPGASSSAAPSAPGASAPVASAPATSAPVVPSPTKSVAPTSTKAAPKPKPTKSDPEEEEDDDDDQWWPWYGYHWGKHHGHSH